MCYCAMRMHQCSTDEARIESASPRAPPPPLRQLRVPRRHHLSTRSCVAARTMKFKAFAAVPVALTLAFFLDDARGDVCPHPPPAPDFAAHSYGGSWFEASRAPHTYRLHGATATRLFAPNRHIATPSHPCRPRRCDPTVRVSQIGKIQTAGGAIFESSCVCTELVVSPADASNGTAVLNSCRDKTPTGAFINATATLVNERAPGWWEVRHGWHGIVIRAARGCARSIPWRPCSPSSHGRAAARHSRACTTLAPPSTAVCRRSLFPTSQR